MFRRGGHSHDRTRSRPAWHDPPGKTQEARTADTRSQPWCNFCARSLPVVLFHSAARASRLAAPRGVASMGLLPAMALLAGAVCGWLPPLASPWLKWALPCLAATAWIAWRGGHGRVAVAAVAVAYFCTAAHGFPARETARAPPNRSVQACGSRGSIPPRHQRSFRSPSGRAPTAVSGPAQPAVRRA